MKVLIAVSSKHGSTREIAESIAETVREADIEVDVVDAEHVGSIDPYDAIIVGSAIYFGRWMGAARTLVNRFADGLRTRPVGLFSSGPMGSDIIDPADSAEGEKLLRLVEAREHRLFAGKADKHEFGFFERRVVAMVKSPYGDHRDWPAIRDWAASVARELASILSSLGKAEGKAAAKSLAPTAVTLV